MGLKYTELKRVCTQDPLWTSRKIKELEARLSSIQATVDAQANNADLWVIFFGGKTAFSDRVVRMQEALRALHKVIEGETE